MATAALASTPYWLPKAVVTLRVKVFARVNGPEGVVVPNDQVDADRCAELYGHPAADGRSRGAGLSDLFWYWLAPAPRCIRSDAVRRRPAGTRRTCGPDAAPRAGLLRHAVLRARAGAGRVAGRPRAVGGTGRGVRGGRGGQAK
ncbi:hypothetical protein [Actinacidiphila sp. ITFR-21]|uniref:hypothetical protein n=1 Tax=Actinacidiphila sp. ITFR-21 TaxID=3075199 RepID=UPI00288C0F79|nr:hypothetical protein [Streptomyces sp. ITFR-21]WNI14134.1 hypothetical protein RLT57_00395 [Streptomyces sp. ITFR-21]